MAGHLIFAQDSALWAVRFDPVALTTDGAAKLVREDVRHGGLFNLGLFDLSSDGTLVYLRADLDETAQSRLMWIDRNGHEEPILEQRAFFRQPRLSADGRKLAVAVGPTGGEEEVWVHDLHGAPPVRVAEGGVPGMLTFSPDGRRLALTHHELDEGRGPNVHWTLSDGSKFDTSPLLTEPYYSRHPQAWSPDGGELLFMGAAPTSGTGWDILALPLTPDASPRPVVQSPFREMQAEFSPDGQWIAFTSNRDGRGEVYVQAYPDGTPRKVSPSQGTDPVWSPDGDELFYLDGNALMAVPIQTAPTLEIGAPSRLFDADGWIMEVRGHTYDVAADGRFVVAKTDGFAWGQRGRLTLVMNWLDEVEARVAAP